MTITRRKFLKLGLTAGMISVLPAPLMYKQAAAALPTTNLSRTDVPISGYWHTNPYKRHVQSVGCSGVRGYAGADPSIIYWDIHSNFDYPNRDHRLAIGGTVPNARGARIIEVHGWLEHEVGPEPNCSEDPADASFSLELDPRFLDEKGINLGGLIRVGDIIAANLSGDSYVAVAPPKLHVEMKSWHEGQKCDKCNCGPKSENPGWTVRPPVLDGCPGYQNKECGSSGFREQWWPWDPRYPSNDPLRKLKAGDYLCVIGALVTDDPHWDEPHRRAAKAWGDRITIWGFQPKEHPHNPARWTEIHPPDHVHVLHPIEQVKFREETVRCVAMVAQAGSNWAHDRILNWDISPPGSRPDPLATLECIEAVGGETTTDLIVEGNSHRTGARITKYPDHVNVYAKIRGESGYFVRKDADFKAIYRVFWRLGPPQLRLSLNVQRIPAGEPVSLVVHALDWHNGSPVQGQVKVDGQVIGETNTPITYAFHEGNRATVLASSYNETPVGLPIVLRTLRAWTDPPNVEGSGQVTVYAVDAATNALVPEAKVFVLRREVAAVGVPFSFTDSCRPVVTRPCPPPCRRPCNPRHERPGCCEPDFDVCVPEISYVCSSISVKARNYEEKIVYQGRQDPSLL
jgi:hypothetical protein